jgi:hypothetical protein
MMEPKSMLLLQNHSSALPTTESHAYSSNILSNMVGPHQPSLPSRTSLSDTPKHPKGVFVETTYRLWDHA